MSGILGIKLGSFAELTFETKSAMDAAESGVQQ
jgi:hypothetical protein